MDLLEEVYQYIKEARNNQISPQNLYDTETIKKFIEDQGDSYFELGDFILTKPIDQPCDYVKYTSKTYCVSNPTKRDWNDAKTYNIDFYFIFRKIDEGVNRRKLGKYDVMAFARPPETMRRAYRQASVDQIADMMWQRAMDEVGEKFDYSKDYIREIARQNKEMDLYMEIYDRDNGVVLPEDFMNILQKGGTSLGELLQRI